MIGKAPVLAWLLTALACFLVGALVGEGWSQAAPRPGFPTIGVVVTVEIAVAPTATPSPTPSPPPGYTAAPSWPVATCDPFGAEAPPCGPTDDTR